MKRRRFDVSIMLGICLVVGGTGSLAQHEEVVPGAGVQAFRGPQGRFVEAWLPGRLENHVVAKTAQGRREIWFLLAPPAEPDPQAGRDQDDDVRSPRCPGDPEREHSPRSLYRLDVRGAGSLTVVRDDLPGDSRSIAATDLDGDGFDDIVLVRESGIYHLRGAALIPLVEGTDLRLTGAGGRMIVLESTRVGARLHGPRVSGGPWGPLAEVDLPAKGALRGHTLMLSRQIPAAYGTRENGSILLATVPSPAGKRRVRTTMVEVTAEGEVSVVESWSRLPAPEDVLERKLLVIDDEPILLVTTKPAGKLALFGEKGLRLFPVEHDRTRLGLPPRFEVETQMNLWQDPVPVIVDVNGDGLMDLVIGYWKGIMGTRVVLDAYVREEGNSFSDSVRTTAFDVEKGEPSLLIYGDDLDGDGLPDLLIRTDKELRMHPGLRSKRGAKLVDSRYREIPLEEAATDEDEDDDEVVVELSAGGVNVIELGDGRRPRVADLDGDGRKEIYVLNSGNGARPSTFRAVWLAPPP